MRNLLCLGVLLLVAAESFAETSWSWPGYPDEGKLSLYMMKNYDYSKDQLEKLTFYRWRSLHDQNQNKRRAQGYIAQHVPGWGGGSCGNSSCQMCYGYTKRVAAWDTTLREVNPPVKKRQSELIRSASLEVPPEDSPTSLWAVEQALRIAELKSSDYFCDLGSGDGRVMIAAAKQYKCTAVGIERNPKYVKFSRACVKEANLPYKQVQVLQGDVLEIDNLGSVTVVYMYLYPSLMQRLIPQLKTLRVGTKIISYMHPIPGISEDRVFEVLDSKGQKHKIYLWIVDESTFNRPVKSHMLLGSFSERWSLL